MVLVAQHWNIANELRKIVHAKIPRNENMCKDKWYGLNPNYKNLSNYHKGTGHHMLFWEVTLEERDWYHLRKQFNKEFYEAIEAFQGKWIIIIPIHVKGLQAEGEETLLRQCLNQTTRGTRLYTTSTFHKKTSW
jgi:hypothetical protein